jgi:DNA replication and repair protein RecF
LDKGFAPVLLLDEVATHLDNRKRDALLDKICALNLQAWITSTEAQNFSLLRGKGEFLTVKNNQIIRES